MNFNDRNREMKLRGMGVMECYERIFKWHKENGKNKSEKYLESRLSSDDIYLGVIQNDN